MIDGCDKHHSCDTCPFDECIVSQKGALIGRGQDRQERRKKVLELASKGLKPEVIRKKVGYKDRGDVYKIIRENRIDNSKFR